VKVAFPGVVEDIGTVFTPLPRVHPVPPARIVMLSSGAVVTTLPYVSSDATLKLVRATPAVAVVGKPTNPSLAAGPKADNVTLLLAALLPVSFVVVSLTVKVQEVPDENFTALKETVPEPS
jgi:hypothetical protein